MSLLKGRVHNFILVGCLSLVGSLPILAQSAGEPWFTDYVHGNRNDWQAHLTEAKIELPSPPTADTLYSLLVAEFGAVGTQLKHHQTDSAKSLLQEALQKLATLKSLETSARTWFISAALNSLAIQLDPWQAPFLGPKVQQEIQKAQEADPTLPEVWLMKGDISYNEPPLFGGSTEKAIVDWQKARELWQAGSADSRHSWLYLLTLANLIHAELKAGQTDKAQEYWQDMTNEAPDLSTQQARFFP